MGLDPGTLATGFGVVARSGGRMSLVASGVIRNSPGRSMPLRLQRIFRDITRLIEEHCPDEFAIESAFYGKNAQSALKLGHARGVAILAAAERELPTTEYSPREIKKAVVGNGNASKEQVRFMVRSLLGLNAPRMTFDASDAIAIAICHLHRRSSPASASRDWKSYVAAHPERLIP
jgi:crossover junction endodeoxyribonuclease RuvC